jgi:hypothetical protein
VTPALYPILMKCFDGISPFIVFIDALSIFTPDFKPNLTGFNDCENELSELKIKRKIINLILTI